MAQVTAAQRKAVARRTGDPSFPMETGAQIVSAIRLRGRGKSKGKGEVLRLASAAVGRLLRSGKINEATAERLRRLIAQARERDNMEAQGIEYELPIEYVNTTPGEPIRLFRFGPLFKGGKMRELTRDLLSKFKLPHYRPPIKLGAHDDDTPAGGHITGLEVREDGLYGLTEYTPQGQAAVEAGNYRYHSPEVIWDGALENPETGESIPGPLIVGTALLHTPHLGESAALYGIEPHYDGGDSMTETLNGPPASFWEQLLARAFGNEPEPQGDREPAPVVGVEPDEFAAVQQERDELQAQIATMEAEKEKAGRVAHFAAELKETVLVEDTDIHDLLANVDDETAGALLTKFKALSAQIVESNLTGDVGSAGDPDTNPHDALNAAVQAKMKEANVAYQDAFAMVREEEPDLFAHLKGAQ